MISFDSAQADVFFDSFASKGFYVDIGVRDGIHDNKTFLLYKNGWTGISVDAHPDYTDICKVVRPSDTTINTICGRDDDNCKFRYNWRGSFSSVYIQELEESRTRLVSKKWFGDLGGDKNNDFLGFKNSIEHAESMSLNTIIDSHNPENKEIDVLSIDVDGSERVILENFDIKKYNPHLVCIELEEHPSSLRGLSSFIIEYMGRNGYIPLAKLNEDHIWCNAENFSGAKLKLQEFARNSDAISPIKTIHPCTYFYENGLKLNEESIHRYKDHIFSLF